jgi:hypothetical protein
MNRAAVIEQIRATQQTLKKLLGLLESSEQDRFASHLYRSRREYRSTCERSGKSGKQIERCVISSFQIAESMGFKATFGNGRASCGLANMERAVPRVHLSVKKTRKPHGTGSRAYP